MFLLHVLILMLPLGGGLSLGCSSNEFSGSVMSVRFGLGGAGTAGHGKPSRRIQAQVRRVGAQVLRQTEATISWVLLHQTLYFA